MSTSSTSKVPTGVESTSGANAGVDASNVEAGTLALLPEDPDASARALAFIAATARSAGVAQTGYRVITNTGPDAGQEVMHLHWHVIGGTRLGGMA